MKGTSEFTHRTGRKGILAVAGAHSLRTRLPFSRPIKPLARHVKIIRPSLTARKPHGNYVVHTPANPLGLVGRVGPKLLPGLAILSPRTPCRQRLPVAAMRPRQLVGHEVLLVVCMNRECRLG